MTFFYYIVGIIRNQRKGAEEKDLKSGLARIAIKYVWCHYNTLSHVNMVYFYLKSKLFLEAVEAKKVDVRKMPVSMNFCAVHRNRYTYYLNTPPNFWDCGIGKPPRNGHLYPLDASATNDDDEEEDFLK